MQASALEPYYLSDFNAKSGTPLDGWSSHGTGKTAKDVALGSSFGALTSYFPEGSPAYRVLSFSDTPDAAYSNSTTKEGGKVNEWLISPAISIPEGKKALMLQYEELALGSIRPGDYSVLVSESESEPDDFTTVLLSRRPKGATNAIVSNTICVPLAGYEGKDIRVAFVNQSSGTFLLGFSGIGIYDYQVSVTSRIPEFMSAEGIADATFDVSITTPAKCAGFTASLTIDGDETLTFSSERDLSAGFSGEISFSPGITLTYGEKKSYRLEIVPADSSLPAYTYDRTVTCAEGFPGVCVMEEATGTWCPACVRGAASIEKFSHDYPGQFFGLAVHERDPMTVPEYNTPLKEQSHISSFPSGWFNRTVKDDPQMETLVSKYVSQRLPSKVEIDKVVRKTGDSIDRLTVYYSPQLCYDTKDADMRAVAVISEDHCKGETALWAQQNGYSGATPETVGGEDWWPYFEFFSDKGKMILPSEMEYNHVTWGIFNDYEGTGSDLSNEWKAYTPQQYSITFDIPYQTEKDGAGVQNLANTAVTVILLDGRTGTVIGADRMEAAKYTGDGSGSYAVELPSPFRVSRHDNTILIVGEGKGSVEIYGTDGRMLGRDTIAEGILEIKGDFSISPLIVRITTDTHTSIHKIH